MEGQLKETHLVLLVFFLNILYLVNYKFYRQRELAVLILLAFLRHTVNMPKYNLKSKNVWYVQRFQENIFS